MATKVLFIEDNPDWQNLVQQLLKTAGHEISSAKTFDVAINILNSKQKFDIIIFDLSLGEVRGDDPFVWLDALLQGLTSRKIAVPPVVIVTGVDVTKRQVVQAFTDYRGTVFSFFEKKDFEPKDFLQSIKSAVDYSPARSASSLLRLLMYALLMTTVILVTFAGLLWSVQQIVDPQTQQAFLRIGGALIIAIPLFILIFSQNTKVENIIEAISKILRG